MDRKKRRGGKRGRSRSYSSSSRSYSSSSYSSRRDRKYTGKKKGRGGRRSRSKGSYRGRRRSYSRDSRSRSSSSSFSRKSKISGPRGEINGDDKKLLRSRSRSKGSVGKPLEKKIDVVEKRSHSRSRSEKKPTVGDQQDAI